MMYRFTLDSITVDEPIGWDGLLSTLQRDKLAKGIVLTQDAKIRFIGTGYDYLLNKRDTEGFCSEAKAVILESEDNGNNFSVFFEGTVFISNITWHERDEQAETRIEDNSYDARINKNKSIGVFPFGEGSKNNIAITPAPMGECVIFTPSTGVNLGQRLRCYKVYDLLRYLIEFMSDGELQFSSSLFDAGGKYDGLLLTYGKAVRISQDAILNTADNFKEWSPKISWKDLFDDLKITNVGFIIDKTTKPQTFRVEEVPYFKTDTLVMTFYDVQDIETSTEVDELWAKIKFGSGHNNPAAVYSFVEDAIFIGHKQEEFPMIGQCNLDNTLDLQAKFNTSSNVIEAMLGGDEQYDKEWTFIMSTIVAVNSYAATKNNWIDSSAERYYNYELTNQNVANNYLGAIPNSIAEFLSVANETFRAELTTNFPYTGAGTGGTPVIFDDETTAPNFDPGANYNPANGRYTVPSSGLYSFVSVLNVNQSGVSPTMTFTFQVWDATFTTLLQSNIPFTDTNPNYHTIAINATFYANAGNIVVVNADVIGFGGTLVIYPTSYFACTASNSAGGVYATYDPVDYPIYRHKFKYPLTPSQWKAIKANPTGRFLFGMYSEQLRQGHLRSIKMNHPSGIADIILNSSKRLNP